MTGIKVAAAARELNLSKVSVHKWVKKLSLIEKGSAYKENGVVFLSKDALRVIAESHQARNPNRSKVAPRADVSPSVSVSDNPCKVNEKGYERLTEQFDREISFLRTELSRRDETIQQILNTQAEERQRTDSIIMKLAHDLEGTRKSALAIEEKVNSLVEKQASKKAKEVLTKKPIPIKPWSPHPKQDKPLAGADWLTRLWVSLVNPEQLRQSEI